MPLKHFFVQEPPGFTAAALAAATSRWTPEDCQNLERTFSHFVLFCFFLLLSGSHGDAQQRLLASQDEGGIHDLLQRWVSYRRERRLTLWVSPLTTVFEVIKKKKNSDGDKRRSCVSVVSYHKS